MNEITLLVSFENIEISNVVKGDSLEQNVSFILKDLDNKISFSSIKTFIPLDLFNDEDVRDVLKKYKNDETSVNITGELRTDNQDNSFYLDVMSIFIPKEEKIHDDINVRGTINNSEIEEVNNNLQFQIKYMESGYPKFFRVNINLDKYKSGKYANNSNAAKENIKKLMTDNAVIDFHLRLLNIYKTVSLVVQDFSIVESEENSQDDENVINNNEDVSKNNADINKLKSEIESLKKAINQKNSLINQKNQEIESLKNSSNNNNSNNSSVTLDQIANLILNNGENINALTDSTVNLLKGVLPILPVLQELQRRYDKELERKNVSSFDELEAKIQSTNYDEFISTDIKSLIDIDNSKVDPYRSVLENTLKIYDDSLDNKEEANSSVETINDSKNEKHILEEREE